MDRTSRILATLSLTVLACTDTQTATSAVWVGPWIPTPNGERRTTIYYGPWQCTTAWLEDCSTKCVAQALTSLGCIWVADIKYDWLGEIGPLPVAGGGRLGISNCC